MTIKKNIIANYASQLYVAAVGILILPLYIQYMGAEAYGLIGFFTMLQAWFALLDMGLTPTISRETARYHGGSMSALAYRQLFRSLSIIFISIALLGGCGLWLIAGKVAGNWLKIQEISLDEVIVAVQIMAISVALRWLGGLYRGVITGTERLVWLSVFNAIIATSRFIAVFASMSIFGFTPFVFFMHQLAVALLEVSGLFIMSHSLLPSLKKADGIIGWSFKPVEPILKFALMIAFTSAVWVFVTQTDKLVLSGILPLDEYGYFTLAVLVASGILVLSAPVSTAIMPRMARLYAEGKSCEMILLYRNSTQVVSIVSGTAALVIAFYAEYLIYAWTGSYDISNNVAPILRLYALGNGILAIVAFPYYLQYAIGNLRYHLIGNLIIVLTLIPAIIYAAKVYGGVGAGWAWLSVNFIYLFAWVCYVHHKLQPGLHLSWLLKDVLVIFISVTIFLCLSLLWPLTFTNRLEIFIIISLLSAISLSVAVLASYSFRKLFLTKIINYFS